MKNDFLISTKIALCLIVVSLFLSRCSEENSNKLSKNDNIKNDSLAFGDTKFVKDGLMGKVYLLPVNTNKIPNFDTMSVADIIYTHSLNIPSRSWATGFPGLPDRSEWFGIEYTGYFRSLKKGHYKFRLLSDDGSKLFIDDMLIINNDGSHGAVSVNGEIDLDNSEHSIKVQYFQGPRFYIALQLFVTLDKEEEQLFPGKYFELITKHANKVLTNSVYIIVCFLVLLLIFAAYKMLNRKLKLQKSINDK